MEICLPLLNQRLSKHKYQGVVLIESQTSGESVTKILGNLSKETSIIWLGKGWMHWRKLVLYIWKVSKWRLWWPKFGGVGKPQPWKTVKGVRGVSKEDLYTASQISRTGFLNHPYNSILIEMQRNWLLYSYQRFQSYIFWLRQGYCREW